MTDEFRKHELFPGDIKRQFKLIGVDPITGENLYAEVMALDAGSIAGAGLTDAQLRATPVPVSGVFFQATQPVSLASGIDVIDRSARLLGHVTVDSTPTTAVTGPLTDAQLRATRIPVDGSGVTQPVSGTFFQGTQPVSAASLPLPTGAALDSTLQAIKSSLDDLAFYSILNFEENLFT